jgi:hypothetical protein
MNSKLKFWGHQMSESPSKVLTARTQIISQTFNTMHGCPRAKFVSHTLFCGAQPIFGEQKMTLRQHFVCSPLRCLKSFQSSPSWSQRGWS